MNLIIGDWIIQWSSPLTRFSFLYKYRKQGNTTTQMAYWIWQYKPGTKSLIYLAFCKLHNYNSEQESHNLTMEHQSTLLPYNCSEINSIKTLNSTTKQVWRFPQGRESIIGEKCYMFPYFLYFPYYSFSCLSLCMDNWFGS